jgi:threonylcarbamoyladenosine tRNA methylthiotransferase MtaB
MYILIKTLGCKANRYESDRIQEKFGDLNVIGDAQISNFDKVDVLIVNTCTVTHVADRKSRQAISHLKKEYPSAKVIVFGCGANIDPEGYKNLPHVDHVIQNPQDLDALLKNLEAKFDNSCESDRFTLNRTRALIKIQDGCNNFCSYCIVPFARGREKSRTSKEIIEEVRLKIDKGYKEIVITGINIGMWKENGMEIADLMQMILDKTTIERVRLSSIEPQNFSDKFISLFKNPRFCPHLHISLQSGSDSVLKLMRRRYDTEMFTHVIDRLRAAVPHISITTDVIVGFPGETDELFEETVKYVQKIAFSKIHIFPYSKRSGTIAANMPNQVPYDVKKLRCERLSKIEEKMRLKFYEDNIGREESVLIETVDENGDGHGLTLNYIKTRVHKSIKPNEIVNVRLRKETLEP